MSIVTKTGDGGMTGLMYGRRVSKSHARVAACGEVDELNAALGLARVSAAHATVREQILRVQKDLVALMGELATMPEDWPRYLQDGYGRITAEQTAQVEEVIRLCEARGDELKDWATPGSSAAGAALDLARAICRRAERGVCALQEAGQLRNPEVVIYLNRVSDLLWLMARAEDKS